MLFFQVTIVNFFMLKFIEKRWFIQAKTRQEQGEPFLVTLHFLKQYTICNAHYTDSLTAPDRPLTEES